MSGASRTHRPERGAQRPGCEQEQCHHQWQRGHRLSAGSQEVQVRIRLRATGPGKYSLNDTL